MKHRVLTITPKPGDNPNHPFIFLGGKWLKECGFDIGGKVLVECRKGALNIRAIRFVSQDNIEGERDKEEVILVANHS